MDQAQQIAMLESIMPEITETRNPRAVMLKCAAKHNLSPAQLEKLGWTYNTAKTLVGFKKQANRGDSFTIVDVPDMVKDYTSYDPAKPQKSSIHAKIDDLIKNSTQQIAASSVDTEANWERLFKERFKKSASGEADSFNSLINKMLNPEGGLVFKDTRSGHQWHSFSLDGLTTKSASAQAPSEEELDNAKRMKKSAMTDMKQACFEAQKNLEVIGDDLIQDMNWRNIPWQDVAEDIQDNFGKAASAIVTNLEAYFDRKNFNYEKADLQKRGFVHKLARDRYGLMDKIASVNENLEIYAEMKGILDKEEELAKSAAKPEHFFDDLESQMRHPQEFVTKLRDDDTAAERAQALEAAKGEAARQSTLQQLILSDPVLQEADPYEVEDLFTTISKFNPAIAEDPKLAAPILKECIQYGGIPMPQLKDLVSINKDLTQTKKVQTELDNPKK